MSENESPEGPPVEGPSQEEIPEDIFDSWWRTYSKYSTERIYSRDEFFDEVASQFGWVPYRERKSRAGTGPARIPKAPSLPVTPENMNVPDFGEKFMEKLEQGLMAKFRPESRESTMYRTMREAERKEGLIKDFKIQPTSKEDFLRDLQDKISSVEWKEKKNVHKATITRPGIRKKYQEELRDGPF